jgi:predicted metal-dependent peptidase
MHLALEHLKRKGSRNARLWNVATDEAINNLLKHEMRIWKKALCSQQFEEMSAEEIYDELLKEGTFKKVYGSCGCPDSFDVHYYGDEEKAGGKQQPQSPWQQKGQKPIDAPKMIKDAASFAKSQGKLPAGIERLFKDLLEPTMNWKELLQKYIMAILPQDWTYIKPSKRALAAGFYMPSIVKETVEIVVAVDSSGSISDEEYAQFLSEIVAMTRAVNNLKATVIVCDAEIQDIVEIDNSFNPYMDIKGRGYGGTSCIPVFKWIHEERNENVKLLVYLTDGYIDEPYEEIYQSGYPVLWVVTAQGRVDFLTKNLGNQIVVQMPAKLGD